MRGPQKAQSRGDIESIRRLNWHAEVGAVEAAQVALVGSSKRQVVRAKRSRPSSDRTAFVARRRGRRHSKLRSQLMRRISKKGRGLHRKRTPIASSPLLYSSMPVVFEI